jgi:hypothetical protein
VLNFSHVGGTVKRVLTGVIALVGLGLVTVAATVLIEGVDHPAPLDAETSSLSSGGRTQQVVEREDDAQVRVVDPVLVVNRDGSTAVGGFVENGTDADVALMSVAVWVDRQPVRVDSTEMWLPALAGGRSQVGAASDAGGFVVPAGIDAGARAEMAFQFDDGTCVLHRVKAVARTDAHRGIYPRSNRPIGPVTGDDLPKRSAACGSERSDG